MDISLYLTKATAPLQGTSMVNTTISIVLPVSYVSFWLLGLWNQFFSSFKLDEFGIFDRKSGLKAEAPQAIKCFFFAFCSPVIKLGISKFHLEGQQGNFYDCLACLSLDGVAAAAAV